MNEECVSVFEFKPEVVWINRGVYEESMGMKNYWDKSNEILFTYKDGESKDKVLEKLDEKFKNVEEL